MNAVVTAGGRVDGEFARRIGTTVKALAVLRGRTMLDATLDALRSAGVPHIAVVGGDEVRAACAGRVDAVIAESDSGAENLRRALFAWTTGEPLLYLTSDMPFIDGASLSEFVDRVPPETLALPIADFAAFERRFPGAPPFGVRIGGERVVNGGAFLVPAEAAPAIERFAVRFFDARKSVARMALLLGPVLCVQFALHRLTIAALERHATRLLGARAQAVRAAAPELAFDVDTLAEYEYAVAHA